MKEILGKIKIYTKRAAVLCSLFLAAFLIGFYLVNLDLGPAQKTNLPADSILSVNSNEELSKKLGGTTVSVESYENWAKRFGLNGSNVGLDNDPDNEGLPNYLEYIHGTNPQKADSDSDGFSDKQEITNGYDPDAPGDARPIVEIAISKINVGAPMVWSKNELEKDMLADLEKGVAHFAKTASPGQNGNMIISGHSSNYIWAKGDYNHIFKDLNNLEKGDVVIVNTMQKNGRSISFRYKVTDKFTTVPNDARIFEETQNPMLTLSTCWPPGTALRRIIIKAEVI